MGAEPPKETVNLPPVFDVFPIFDVFSDDDDLPTGERSPVRAFSMLPVRTKEGDLF